MCLKDELLLLLKEDDVFREEVVNLLRPELSESINLEAKFNPIGEEKEIEILKEEIAQLVLNSYNFICKNINENQLVKHYESDSQSVGDYKQIIEYKQLIFSMIPIQTSLNLILHAQRAIKQTENDLITQLNSSHLCSLPQCIKQYWSNHKA